MQESKRRAILFDDKGDELGLQGLLGPNYDLKICYCIEKFTTTLLENKNIIDFIILDIDVEDPSGKRGDQLVRNFFKNHPTCQVPCFLMSGQDNVRMEKIREEHVDFTWFVKFYNKGAKDLAQIIPLDINSELDKFLKPNHRHKQMQQQIEDAGIMDKQMDESSEDVRPLADSRDTGITSDYAVYTPRKLLDSIKEIIDKGDMEEEDEQYVNQCYRALEGELRDHNMSPVEK